MKGSFLAVAAAVALAVVGCGGSGSPATGGTPVRGGTAVMAEPPSAIPDYIFPFTSSGFITVNNQDQFGYLMYRPLYWFGKNGKPLINQSLSLAYPPTWSGNTATIRLKPYKWSNGSPVTAQNTMFWLNMLQDVGATDWGAYNGFPNKFVSSMKVVSPTELTMTVNKPYSHTWFLYNDLSQVTPMPTAWDRTAAGPSDCSARPSDCAAVYAYLDAQSKRLSTYTTSPLWGIVDGPWKLASFNSDGNVTFVPNKSYSGPVKPTLSRFEEVPFTTEAAEYNVLRASGSGGQTIDVGYLSTVDAPARPANATVGRNPVSGYTLDPWYSWGISYSVVNLNSTTGNGPVNRQLYFRQALEYLLNQQSVISGPLRGYGQQTVGPVDPHPVTPYASSLLKSGTLFPYSPAKAKELLSSHGWHVVPNGTTTCASPSKCGPGVKQGQPLVFNMAYATGQNWIQSEVTQLQSNATLAGIKINLDPKPFNQVTTLAGGNCKVTRSSCDWDLADWGLGWSFAPDYDPTGETLFMCGSPADSSGYCDAANDAMIEKTLTSDDMRYMYQWQDYLARQMPFLWQPQGPYQLTEVANDLRGVLPESPTLTITPESWHFVK
jgi:peptide/nickel transport system substrate-binding protein